MIAQSKMIERAKLDQSIKKIYDEKIHNQILDFLKGSKSVALFASFAHEIETHSLIDTLLKREYLVYLPKVEEKIMNFYEIKSKDDLFLSSLGILEPRVGKTVSKQDIDLIVVPLLAYNKDRFRIGYGGGYYDSYLKDYSGLKVGAAYSFQFTNKTFVEEHDVACDYIVTERGIE